MYYNDDFYQEDYTIQRELNEEEQKRLLTTQFMEEVIDQIYGKIPFNKETLEHSLDELCYYFDIPPHKGDVQVKAVKETSKVFDLAVDMIKEQGRLRGHG
jgi:hypothetical protein